MTRGNTMRIALRRRGLVAGAALLGALTVACGDGSDGSGADVLPLEEGAARAVGEQFLAENPTASLRPGHIAIMQLEAAGTHDGDTGEEEGVDTVSYHFDVETELTISVDESAAQLGRLVVSDADGFLALEIERGGSEVILLEPGPHTIELHHAHKSDTAAPTQLIFLRPELAQAEARTGPGQRAQVAANVAKISAGKDCKSCDFSNSDLSGLSFAGLDLSDCLLHDAQLSGTSFACATMSRCQLQKLKGGFALHVNVTFDGADLIGARFDGIVISGGEFKATTCRGRSTPTRLDGSTWAAEKDARIPTLAGASFKGSSLVGASFNNTLMDRVFFDDADLTLAVFWVRGTRLRFPGATLVESDLSGTTLDKNSTFAAATLSDVEMTGADLSGVSFVGANLSGVLFADAVLDDADFSGIAFSGVDLAKADLSGAILSAETSFAGATLTNGVDSGVVLACDAAAMRGGCLLSSIPAQFAGADLSFANLNGVDLSATDLSGVTLDNAQLLGANLSDTNLHGAKMRGALLGVAPGSGAKATTLHRAFMTDIDLSDADLRSADLSEAHLYGDQRRTLLVRTRLDSANLVGAICSGATFSGSLTDASFNGAQLVDTIFDGADLTNAKFDGAYLQGADFSTAASVTGVSLSNAAVSTMPGTWTFTEQDGTPSTFMFAATQLGALAARTDVICPDNSAGPCVGMKLTPSDMGPFPPVPACAPSGAFCWENCLPDFNCRSRCASWSCGATCASCG